jgi:integrase
MSSAWVYQDDKQVKKHGKERASWYVGWIDPEGKRRCKSCGPGTDGKRSAEKLRKKREAELLTGTYQDNARKTWKEFRQEYETKVLGRLKPRGREGVLIALRHFEALVKPVRVGAIKTQTVDDFAAALRDLPGKSPGTLMAPATVNTCLARLRAALRKAHAWGYLPKVPEFAMDPEPKRLNTYVPPEHFAAIYAACGKARKPVGLPYEPADWWRALLVTGYMTGWRLGELLALRREDLDLDAGVAITRAEDNKGNRDERTKLAPVVVAHLRKLAGFDPMVFPWHYARMTLYRTFVRIQQAAGIKLPCRHQHEHTLYCHAYGFHDLRRAFATMNADRLTPDALQALMRHKSYSTTQRYIAIARQLDDAVASLYVPDVLKASGQ